MDAVVRDSRHGEHVDSFHVTVVDADALSLMTAPAVEVLTDALDAKVLAEVNETVDMSYVDMASR